MNLVSDEPCPSLGFSGKIYDFRHNVRKALSSRLHSTINDLCDKKEVTYTNEDPLANIKNDQFVLNIL